MLIGDALTPPPVLWVNIFLFGLKARIKELFKPEFDFSPRQPPPAEEPKEDWGTNRLDWKVGDEMTMGEWSFRLGFPAPREVLTSWSADALIYESEAYPGVPLVWEGRAVSYSARERQRKKERDELEKKVAAESVYEMAKAAEFQKQQGL